MTVASEEIVQTLRRAAEAVDEANIADELRPAAFAAAVELFAGHVAPAAARETLRGEAGARDGSGSGESVLGRIARTLDIDEEGLAYIYEEEAGDVRLIIRRTMLSNPKSRAAAMRDVAQLVMAGRQAGRLEEWTPYERIRLECAELGVLDRANFATEVQALDIRHRGGRRAREARLTRHGLDEAAGLIRGMIEEFRRSAASH